MEKRFEETKECGLFDNDKNRYIIEPCYPQALAKAMVDLLNEQDKKIKELETELNQKNKLIWDNDNNVILCGDCYCINNDVRKIVEENQQLKDENKQIKFDCAMYKSANYLINDIGIDKAREIMFQSDKKLKQSQNSKAIEVLEQAKIEFETYYADNLWNYPEWIDNKITELRGGEK